MSGHPGGRIRTGAGGFTPRDVAQKDWLPWYAQQFNAAEINGSFYRTPTLEAVQSWCERTPADFRFAWKASKFITHWKRLKASAENSIALMVTRLEVLGEKCGPVLFQLPGRFHADRNRLADFIKMLPETYRYAFEFRHESWYEDAILQVLRDHNIALCLSDHHEAPAPWAVTADLVYVRGHGPTGRYKGHYPDATLKGWAEHISAWREEQKTVYVFFDNDQKSAAPTDAKQLVKLCA